MRILQGRNFLSVLYVGQLKLPRPSSSTLAEEPKHSRSLEAIHRTRQAVAVPLVPWVLVLDSLPDVPNSERLGQYREHSIDVIGERGLVVRYATEDIGRIVG